MHEYRLLKRCCCESGAHSNAMLRRIAKGEGAAAALVNVTKMATI
jgi:hypothetical protein